MFTVADPPSSAGRAMHSANSNCHSSGLQCGVAFVGPLGGVFLSASAKTNVSPASPTQGRPFQRNATGWLRSITSPRWGGSRFDVTVSPLRASRRSGGSRWWRCCVPAGRTGGIRMRGTRTRSSSPARSCACTGTPATARGWSRRDRAGAAPPRRAGTRQFEQGLAAFKLDHQLSTNLIRVINQRRRQTRSYV